MARNLTEQKMTADLIRGAQPGRLVQIILLGVQEQAPYQGTVKPPVDEVRFVYELSNSFMKDENGVELKDKPRWFGEDMPLHKLSADKAKSTARYHALDPLGTAKGDLGKLLTLPCQVVIVQNPGKGKHVGRTFENIGDVTEAINVPGYTQPPLVNPSLYFDPQDPEVSVEVFKTLPKFIQEKIAKALDYQTSPLFKKLNAAVAPAPQQEASGDKPY